MNTIKLTITGSQLDIEYHGSDLIPTASLNLDGKHDLRKLLAEMAEWCSRRVASPQEPEEDTGDESLQGVWDGPNQPLPKELQDILDNELVRKS